MTDPVDPILAEQHEAERHRSIPLRALSGSTAIREWREITWSPQCIDCGCELYGPADEDERMYDGDSVVCTNCGCLHQMYCDEHLHSEEDDGHISASEEVNGQWVYLLPTALAGFRRLLGIRPSWMVPL